jgi:hypothetical protein
MSLKLLACKGSDGFRDIFFTEFVTKPFNTELHGYDIEATQLKLLDESYRGAYA